MGVSNYPSDFQTVDPTTAPVDGYLLFGVEPWLLMVLVLIIVGVGIAAFLMGVAQAEREENGADGAISGIHAAILRASRHAMNARSSQLQERAAALRETITRCLGPVIDLGKGWSPSLKALDEALKGASGKDHGSGKADKQGCKCGKPRGDCSCGNAVTITVPVQDGGCKPAGCHAGGHRSGHHDDSSMTSQEQTDALAKAVRSFHDYWSQSEARKTELRAARRALSRRPSASLLRSERSGHEGDHAGERVWDRL